MAGVTTETPMDGLCEATLLSGHHHVHFPEEQLVAHDSEIVIKMSGDNRIDIHLGFLQIHHHYRITFTIKDSLEEDIDADPIQNLHVKLYTYSPTEDGEGHELVLDLHAHKEKLLQEHLVLTSRHNQDSHLTLLLHARVLGKGKGKPSLKKGIHCMHVDHDEDSEHSDWQGFND